MSYGRNNTEKEWDSIMGSRIKQLREERKMTQEELGKVLGVQKSAIAKYENGRVGNMKRSSIKILAKFFGVKPTYLLGYSEKEDIAITETLKIGKLSSEEIALIHTIRDLTDEETKELSNFVDYLISKRK